MSELREQLIKEGKLQTVEGRQQVERISKQLYNVFRGKAIELDPTVKDDTEEWKDLEDDFQEMFRAMGRYVISTYTENDRLREKIKRIEAQFGRYGGGMLGPEMP